MTTKIQINSLEALERLIGNDNELEIEIRNSVVQNFSKKFLKPLLVESVLLDLQQTVFNEIVEERTWSNIIFKDKYKRVMQDIINHVLKNNVEKIMEQWHNAPEFKKTVLQYADSFLKEFLTRFFRDKFADDFFKPAIDSMLFHLSDVQKEDLNGNNEPNITT